jgi:enoyl-CoA hydratase/carnithine racemase
MALIEISGPQDGVVTLTLARPEKKNALSIELRDAVADALDRLAADPNVRVLVVTGAGNVFSAGFDLAEFSVDDEKYQRRLWKSSDRFHHAVLGFPVPTIAAVNGPALAGGFDLAVLTDMRIASETASFAHPEHGWGDVVYRPLRELVGASVARDLALTGRRVDATEALALGLVSRVVPSSALAAEVRQVAAEIATAPRPLLERMKAKFLDAAGIPPALTTLEL